MQELSQTVCIGVFNLAFAHFFKYGKHLVLYYGYFVQQGAVERNIGIDLEGDNPFFLSRGNAGASAYGLECGITSVLVIAHNAAQKSDVLGGDTVVVIKLDGSKSRHVDAEFLVVGDLLCKDGVQRMVCLN